MRWLIFAMLFSLASPAAAQGRACEYDLECGVAQVCSDEGMCVSRGAGAAADDGGCGADRRCRIDRLKRRNRAKRHAATLEEERHVRWLIEQEEKRRLEEFPREKNPLSMALRVSRLGYVGAHIGYVIARRIQPELEFAYSDIYAYAPATGTTSGIDGYLEEFWFKGGLSYFLLDSWFSPYLSAGFMAAYGTFNNYSFDFGGSFNSSMQSRFHAAEFGGGFDLQFKFGLQTRLGVVYRPLVYNQARIGPGQYDPQTRQGLAAWFKRGAAVDVVWLIGWAI